MLPPKTQTAGGKANCRIKTRENTLEWAGLNHSTRRVVCFQKGRRPQAPCTLIGDRGRWSLCLPFQGLCNPHDSVRSVWRSMGNTDARHAEVLQSIVDTSLTVDV